MQIDPSTLTPKDAYLLMTACLVPRPIGWASTVSADGVPNLAPFSYFGGVSSSPMTVMLSVGRRRGRPKDTGANLLATEEAVLHIATRSLADAMVATSAEAEPDVDEFALAGLTAVPSERVAPPRIAEAAIAMEAVLRHHMEVGAGPVDMFLLEVVRLHLEDDVLVDGRPDPARLAAVGRLGGTAYCDTSYPFHIARPS
ncbi:MAG: flavin reductase family protein [Planctomycetota bacterium]|nr:flavin reductase family protein [Planctomycetota bacterium]